MMEIACKNCKEVIEIEFNFKDEKHAKNEFDSGNYLNLAVTCPMCDNFIDFKLTK